MIRKAFSPNRLASSRYSSTTACTSRGGTLCRSNTSVMGIRMGSESMGPKNQKARSAEADRAGFGVENCAHLKLSHSLCSILAQDRFHLILQPEFQLLKVRFLHLLFVTQMRSRPEAVQLGLQLDRKSTRLNSSHPSI